MSRLSWLSDSIREFFRKGDLLLLSLCLAASGFGLVLIFSATRYIGGYRNIIIQALAICLGVAVYILLSSVDIELFTEKSWKWMLAFNVVINGLILTPLGYEAGGNRSWLSIPGFPVNLQPGEIAKLTFVLLLAWQITRLQERGISRPSSVFQIAGHTLVMFGIIAVTSGDFGMGLTYLFIFVIMAWAGGVKKRWFLLAAVVCVVGAVVIWPRISHMYFAQRFAVVIDHLLGNPDTLYEQTQGAGWQQTRSILAIGSGGLTGMGYLNGVQTQSLYKQSLPPGRPTRSSPCAARSSAWWAVCCSCCCWGPSFCGASGWPGGPVLPGRPSSPWGTPACCWPRWGSMWACVCTSSRWWASPCPLSATAAPPLSPCLLPWVWCRASKCDPCPAGCGIAATSDCQAPQRKQYRGARESEKLRGVSA